MTPLPSVKGLETRISWQSYWLSEVMARDLLDLFLKHSAIAPYWSLADAMEDAGLAVEHVRRAA
jgi:hypothetical protein